METKEIFERIQDRKQSMQGLFERMDKDRDAYYLKPYRMKQLPPYQDRNMENVANVTLNDPLLFATKAIAIMSSAQRQTQVEGQDVSDKQASTIERFLDDVLYMVNERLVSRGKLGLDSFAHEQTCLRGRVVGRVSVKSDGKDSIIAKIVPVDARQFVNEAGDEGLIWGAAMFPRTAAQVEAEYGVQARGQRCEVTDYWDEESNVIFVDGEKIKEQANPYGQPTFVVAVCPIGSTFFCDDAVEHEGESIFWANRALWEEKNRTASILQTMNVKGLFGPLQYETAKETPQKPAESPYAERTVHAVEMGGGYKPIPLSDIRQATRLFYAVLDSSLQKGSLAVVDYGTLSFPLSAIAITRLTSSRDDVFWPRLHAEALWYQGLSRMIIDQCVALGGTIRLGRPGNQNTYSLSDLKGDYEITYRFFTESKEQQIADLQIASVAQNFVSSDTIRREILRLQNPEEEEMKLLAEQAERMDPALMMYRRMIQLIRDERPIEAEMLLQRIETMLRQRRMMEHMEQAGPQGEGGEPRTAGGDLMDLLEEGGGGGRGRPTAPATPTEPQERTEVEEAEYA